MVCRVKALTLVTFRVSDFTYLRGNPRQTGLWLARSAHLVVRPRPTPL